MQYTYHIRQIEQELVNTHGWLKPYKMNELAGASALDRQQKELEQRKKDARLTEIKEKASRLSLSRQNSRQLSVSYKKLSKKNIAVNDWNEVLDSVAHQTEWRNLFSEDEIDQAYQTITSNKKLMESSGTSGTDSSDYEEVNDYQVIVSEEEIEETEVSETNHRTYQIKKNPQFCIRNSSSKSIKISKYNGHISDKDRYSNTDLGYKNEFTRTQIFTPLNIDKMHVKEGVIPFPVIRSRNKVIHVTNSSSNNTRKIHSSIIKARSYTRSSINSKDSLMQIRSAFCPTSYLESQLSPDRSLNRPKSANSKNKTLPQNSITKVVKQQNKKYNIAPDSPEAHPNQLKSFTIHCVKVQLKPKNNYTSCGRLLANYIKR